MASRQAKAGVDDLGTQGYDGKFVARLGLGYSFPKAWSEETEAFSPEKATWHHPEEDYAIQWEAR